MKIIRKFFVFALVCSMVSLTGCGSSKETGANNKNSEVATSEDSNSGKSAENPVADYKLLSDGVLNVGCQVGYPPFEDYAEDGTTPIGYDIDIITEIAKRLGLKVNIVNTAWDGIFAGIDVNYDVVCSGVTINKERKETMLFSTPYINNYQAVVVPKDSKLKITGFNDLDGKTIAVQKETTSDILMSDYKSTGSVDVEIVANEKVTSCFTQLTNGEIDAVVVDSTVANGYVMSKPDKYKIAYEDDSEPEEFGIAMGLKNTGLQTAINKELDEMKADHFIEDTYEYWFGKVSK